MLGRHGWCGTACLLLLVWSSAAADVSCPPGCVCSRRQFDIFGEEKYFLLNCTETPYSVANASSVDVVVYQSQTLLDTSSLTAFHHLRGLTVIGGLESLTVLPAPMVTLQTLTISGTAMSYLPDHALFSLSSNLLFVSLADNQLEFISRDAFTKLITVQTLDLSGNMLHRIHGGLFYSLINLQRLDLSHNQLYSVSSSNFLGLNNLIELNLDSNDIHHLDGIDLPRNGADIFVRDNPLLDVLWDSRSSIGTLDMSGHHIKQLKRGSFLGGSINTLNISGSQSIELIDDDVFINTTIGNLIMSGNDRLRYVSPRSLRLIRSLNYLNISVNSQLEVIPESLSSAPGLKIFSFRNNDLLCDCNLYWLKLRQSQDASGSELDFLDEHGNISCSDGRSRNLDSLTVSAECAPQLMYNSTTNITVEEGASLTLMCKVLGRPTPRLSWSYGGRVIPQTVNINMTGDDLAINSVRSSNAGLYQCTAQNTQGTLHVNFSVWVIRDNAKVIIIKTGMNSVELSWRVENPQNKYKVVLINVKDNTQESYSLHPFPRSRHSQSFTLSHLEAGSTYRVCIALESQQNTDSDRCETITTLTEETNQSRGITDYSLYGIITASVVSVVFILLIVCVCLTSKRYTDKKRKRNMMGVVSESSYGLMTTSFSQRSNLSSMFDNPCVNLNPPLVSSGAQTARRSESSYRLRRTNSDPLITSCLATPDADMTL